MTLLELLDDCARKGIALSADGDKLRVKSPQAIAPEVQAALQRHKPEILARLRSSGGALAPLARAPRGAESRPLSVAQQSLWFLHRLDPATLPAYNIRKAFVLEGPLDAERWADAFGTVVGRHESLRASFEAVDEHPLARIATIEARVELVDLTEFGLAAQEEEVRRRIDEEGRHAFDLSRPPLFRASLLRLSSDRSIFLLNAHHLIADAWSAGVILREMREIYDGRSPEPATSTTYDDYVEWQSRRIASGEVGAHVAYWKEKLAGIPPAELPIDRTGRRSYDGASEPYVLPRALAERIRAFAAAHGVTLYSAFLASFAALLHRMSGQADFSIGASVAGRTRRDFEDIVGLFADVVVLPMNVGDAPAFAELAARVQQTGAEAFEHQEAPFDLVVKALRPERVSGQNPLFQVLFLFLQSEAGEIQLPSVASKFDLSLHVEDTGAEIRGLVEYKTDLFERPTIRELLSSWLELLQAAIEDPSRRVWQLPLVGDAARRELLFARNQVRPAELPHETIAEWLEAQVERFPDRIAVKCGDVALTYGQLDERANRLAHALRERGVGPEVRVGLLLQRSADIVVAILGVLKAGGAYVPFDPADPPLRLEFMREHSGVAMVIEDLDALPEGDASLARERLVNGARRNNAAYVIYTSGSTGQPRGVVVTHANVLRLMVSTRRWFDFGENDVWTLFHSCAFDFSVWEIWGALLYGGRVIVVPHLTSRSPEAFHRLLREEGVTVLNQTPSAFRSLIEIPDRVESLRWVIFGGEALDLQMLGPWFARYGNDGPKLVNMYGITETTVHVTWRQIAKTDVEANVGSVIGARIPDLTLYILDENLEPVPSGVAGQLHVGGAGLSRGYLGRPGLTAEKFIPDPFSSAPGARLYRTGDLARWRGDDVEYLGRCDEQVKIRGFRIEPGEIESALRMHDGVRECTVIARNEDGQKRLVAYYIPAGQTIDPAELRAVCEQRLPPHMIPAAYVAVASWPRTRNDKLDRARLPLPEAETATARLAYEPPRNETERLLASIWERVLNAGRVGVHDDFFALGGDSILCLEVLSQMRRAGLESSVAQLYRNHTVAELARVATHVTTRDANAAYALLGDGDRRRLPDGLEDAYPLSQLQGGMLYEEQLHPESAIYHDIFSFHLRLPFDERTWSSVLQDCVDRNAALRTSFDLTHFTEPLQFVHRKVPANVRFEDLSALSDQEQERRIAGIVDDERAQRFDYAAPPLLRFHVVRRSGDRTQIVFGFHHAILDGWSVAVMFSRLLSAYLAELKLRAPLAPETLPSVRYADFVAAERAALHSDGEFWRSEASTLPFTPIPRRDDAPGGKRVIATVAVEIPQATGEGLVRAARAAGAPLKSALLAAHLRVLGVLTGQSEAVTGLVTNARPEQPGADRLLGLFLNTLPLRVDLTSGTFVDLIRRTFAEEQRLLEHRRFPMAAIKRIAGGRTLFEAAFNFVHFHVYQEVIQTAGLEVLGHRVWEETDFPFLAQFSVHPGSSRVELALVHDASEFSAEQMEQIAEAYARCLEAMAAHADAPFREHSLLSGRERALIREWGRQPMDGAPPAVFEERPLHRWFERQVERTPEAIAVRLGSGGGEELTYRELDERANRLANHLRSMGVGRETLVGLCLDRSIDLVVAILGILKAGGAYVPLDPSYPASRLQFIIEDSRAPVVVTHSAYEGLLRDARLVLIDRHAEAIGAQNPEAPAIDSRAGDAAYVIYTSGSTGKPKGVIVTHANVSRLMAATEALFGFGESDVWTLFHSYAFDFSVWEIWGALLYGGRLMVVPYATSREPGAFHRLLVEEGVTVLNQTPTAFYQLMDFGAPPRLRTVIFGGEALDFQRLRAWFDRHGDERPQLVNMYGITETTVHVTHRPVRAEDALRPRSVIGRPLPHLEAFVLDPAGEEVPIGAAGELYIGGGGVARGYLRRDELTATRFVEGSRGRLYRTGDLARWLPSGELEYRGRIDTQVKIRGFRIELGEIEHALHDDVRIRDAAVVLRDGRLVAYVVADSPVAPAELRRTCDEQLPDYMVPAAYVQLDELPLTANGKLDRNALPDPGGEALPVAEYVAPGSAIERRLCAMCEEVLGVPSVGIRHSFFDLGGHSLHATQLIARVREAFAVDLPLRTLFEHPTIEKLAGAIVAQRNPDRPPADSGPTRSRRRQIQIADEGSWT